MIVFLDTNVFLRYFVPATEQMKETVRSLFAQIERGTITATTTEVVLHELCYVLGSPRQYAYDSGTIVDFLETMLSLSGMTFAAGEREAYLRAADIFRTHPRLEYSDALVVARAERSGARLVTFDEALGALPFVDRWEPGGAS